MQQSVKYGANYYDNVRAGESQDFGDHDVVNHSYIVQEPPGGTKKKSKKREPSNQDDPILDAPPQMQRKDYMAHHSLPPAPAAVGNHASAVAPYVREDHKDRIWNTSTAEERERIKEFWLGLAESDRRGLVRIEKEAVLKKMKEQQKHSCSCTVCGRKRTAIEEELEVLYDAYYDELETYANHQHFGLDTTNLPSPQAYNRQRLLRPPNPALNARGNNLSSRDFTEDFDELDEGDYSDEGDEDLSDEELESSIEPSGGIFSFGNSLTAQGKPDVFGPSEYALVDHRLTGGILTVADDLLKNDGKKFIEMMEQFAERRMQREEESRMVASGMGHPSMRHPPDEEEEDIYDDEDEGEEYNTEEEDEFEDDEMVKVFEHFYGASALTFLGGHVRRTTHGGGSANVPDLRCTDVRAKGTERISAESG